MNMMVEEVMDEQRDEHTVVDRWNRRSRGCARTTTNHSECARVCDKYDK